MSTLGNWSVCLVLTTVVMWTQQTELNMLLNIWHGHKCLRLKKPLDHILTREDKARSSSTGGECSLHQRHVLLVMFDLFFYDYPQHSVSSAFIMFDCFLNMLSLFLPLVHLAVRKPWFISTLQVVLDRICQKRVNSQGKNNVEKQIARNMCNWWKRHECRTCLGFIDRTELLPFPSNILKSECWQPRRESCDLTYYCTFYYTGVTIIQPFAKVSSSNTILLCNLKRESSAFWALEVGKD